MQIVDLISTPNTQKIIKKDVWRKAKFSLQITAILVDNFDKLFQQQKTNKTSNGLLFRTAAFYILWLEKSVLHDPSS